MATQNPSVASWKVVLYDSVIKLAHSPGSCCDCALPRGSHARAAAATAAAAIRRVRGMAPEALRSARKSCSGGGGGSASAERGAHARLVATARAARAARRGCTAGRPLHAARPHGLRSA